MSLKTMFTAGAATLVMLAGVAQAEPVKIGVAAEPYPPFSAPDSSGNWVGWEIEMMDAICAAAELECVLTPVAWDGIIPSLTGSQIDVIMSSMSVTEDRMKSIDFSDPYYNTPAVIATAKGSGITPDAAGLAGKIIGVQASTIHQDYAQTHFGDAEIKIYQTQDEVNQDLVSGRIDATQADSVALADFVSTETGACCEIVGNVADDPSILGLGVGAGVRKGETELLAKLNAGIAKVIEDGTRAKITEGYFATPIYAE